MQPGRVSAHSPAGFIGYNPVGLTHGLADGRVDRLASGSRSQHTVDTATGTERDAKQASQAADALAMRQPALLVEFDDGGLGIRSQLSGSGAQRIRRLQGMASLNPPVAVLALPYV